MLYWFSRNSKKFGPVNENDNTAILKKIARFYQLVKEGPQNCLLYLKLPWIGNISLKFEKQVKSTVQNCFSAVKPCIIFQTRKILPWAHHTTKLGRVVIRVPLLLLVRGLHMLNIAGENHSTHSRIDSKQRKANKSFACKAKTPLN